MERILIFFRKRKNISSKTINSNERVGGITSNQLDINDQTKNDIVSEEKSSSLTIEKDSDNTIASSTEELVKSITKKLHTPADLVIHYVTETITVVFLENLIKEDVLNEKILPKLQNSTEETPVNIQKSLPLSQVSISDQLDNSVKTMLFGAVLIHIEGYPLTVLAEIPKIESRSLSAPENESQVIGSQVGFNESISTNISLIRRYIMNPNLCNEKLIVGKQTNTNLTLLFIDGIATEQNVNTVRQRIQNLDIEDLLDSAMLAELIDDSSISIFPQMLLTERPDRFCDGLLSGKVGILVDGSSMGILCPIS
ncbi:MAG: spore germination protein, partial [Psychrobacillus psychrodurans]